MQYLMMIYENSEAEAKRPAALHQKIMGDYKAFTSEVESAGIRKGGNALHPGSTATTVRVRDGKVLTTDGPFTETKEELGGYYVLDCKDLDDAIQWAAKIPHAAECAIEIRPIMVIG